MNSVFSIFESYFNSFINSFVSMVSSLTSVFVDSSNNLTGFFYALCSLAGICLGLACIKFLINLFLDRFIQ